MTAKGSLREWQEFLRIGANPQDRFRDCASAGLMAARGWFSDPAPPQNLCPIIFS
jgi:hypothetical protein